MTHLFWRHFFRGLVFTAALSEWICAAWILIVVAGVAIPLWMHLAAPLALHGLNRRVLGGAGPAMARLRGEGMRRAYVRVVFTSLFGMAFLLLNGLMWSVAGAGLQLASLAGLPVSPSGALSGARWLGSAGLLGVAAALIHGYGRGQRDAAIVRLDVAVAGLARAFDGFRILQLSDIHLGSFMDAARLRPYIEEANALEPDLVCITGDITDGLDHAAATFPVLAGLRARHGVVAILGNHDMYTGAQEVAAALARYTDFTLLRDAAAVIEHDGARLHILGLDDMGLDWARGVREHPALAELCAAVPMREPMVLLSHRPDLFEQAAGLAVALVLSGHTHGGQIALPWPAARPASLARFMTRYPRGTFANGGSTLHVNLGLGVTGQPVRVLTPREITLVTLRNSEPESGD
ncbi:MAG: metallophosphoesterase [Deltaproteobacteria bacterium]|nr:metallophosphoesterase [Deltaproteobacteria bacterium]